MAAQPSETMIVLKLGGQSAERPLMVIPKKPTRDEFRAMVAGPKVDVYVGANKKHYNLPKNLLCYYSRYFDRCFNGAFKEAEEQKLELLEDKISDFEAIFDFMLHGSAPHIEARFGEHVKACMDIITYADKFEMGEIFCELLFGKLEVNLVDLAVHSYAFGHIKPNHIELVFRLTKPGSRLRTLVAKDVLSYHGLKGDEAFKELELKIPEFAYEMLQQIRSHLQDGTKWADPLSDKEKTD